ncbi:hypothetical protein [Streptomyces sp. NPDC060035]|uniref:hypothetical protein n=1 Tax=Streptomyces sp. NPDC060035 TaxID=3347044 RepID=UPI0036AEC69C
MSLDSDGAVEVEYGGLLNSEKRLRPLDPSRLGGVLDGYERLQLVTGAALPMPRSTDTEKPNRLSALVGDATHVTPHRK